MAGDMSVSNDTACDWSTVDCDGSGQWIGGKPPKDPTLDEDGKVCRSTVDEATATCHDARVSPDEVSNEETAKDRAAGAYKDCVEQYDGDDANYCRDAVVRKYARERKGDPEPACDPLNASCQEREELAAKKVCKAEVRESYDQCLEDGKLTAEFACADGTLPDGSRDASPSRAGCWEAWRRGMPGTQAGHGTEEYNSTSLEGGPGFAEVGMGKSVGELRTYSEERGETGGYAKECADMYKAAQARCVRP